MSATPSSNEMSSENTDRHLWREVEGDFYSPSIHVTQGGGIGINVGGHVIVKTLRQWHAHDKLVEALREAMERGKRAISGDHLRAPGMSIDPGGAVSALIEDIEEALKEAGEA